MSEKKQPITRAEFEAGVEFYHSPNLKEFDYMDTYKYLSSCKYIADKNGYYCSIQYIDKEGCLVMSALFGKLCETKILFKNCLRAK